MEKGNVRLAVYWANCIIRRMPDSDTGYEHRAEAYELGGKYEKALEDYRMAESLTNKYYPSPPYIQMARVYYKKNDTNDAYKYYMKEFSMKDNHRRVKWIVSIICGRDVIGKKLNPYSSYTEFLDFMEKEHEIHGKPEEYEKYMDTLREIKDDMNYIEIEK
jgi:tetratricopeptide (TPR) repeat protein